VPDNGIVSNKTLPATRCRCPRGQPEISTTIGSGIRTSYAIFLSVYDTLIIGRPTDELFQAGAALVNVDPKLGGSTLSKA